MPFIRFRLKLVFKKEDLMKKYTLLLTSLALCSALHASEAEKSTQW